VTFILPILAGIAGLKMHLHKIMDNPWSFLVKKYVNTGGDKYEHSYKGCTFITFSKQFVLIRR
jgi:hypothetical protein